jgi:enoyl-CoA hydratase/carnithine racemase
MSLIEYRIDEAVAIVTLNRPETNNAQNPPLAGGARRGVRARGERQVGAG